MSAVSDRLTQEDARVIARILLAVRVRIAAGQTTPPDAAAAGSDGERDDAA